MAVSFFKTLSDDFKAAMYARVSTPLAEAFVTSWILWNIQAVLIIVFENKAMSKRQAYVTDHFIQSSAAGFWYPLT